MYCENQSLRELVTKSWIRNGDFAEFFKCEFKLEGKKNVSQCERNNFKDKLNSKLSSRSGMEKGRRMSLQRWLANTKERKKCEKLAKDSWSGVHNLFIFCRSFYVLNSSWMKPFGDSYKKNRQVFHNNMLYDINKVY